MNAVKFIRLLFCFALALPTLAHAEPTLMEVLPVLRCGPAADAGQAGNNQHHPWELRGP